METQKFLCFYQIYTLFCINNTFISNARLKSAKTWAKVKQHPEAKLLLFKYNSLYSSTLLSKNNRRFSKKCTKNNYVCLNEVIWSMTMKMRLKMRNRSNRYGRNRPRPRYRHKYTKYKMRLSILMDICIK